MQKEIWLFWLKIAIYQILMLTTKKLYIGRELHEEPGNWTKDYGRNSYYKNEEGSEVRIATTASWCAAFAMSSAVSPAAFFNVLDAPMFFRDTECLDFSSSVNDCITLIAMQGKSTLDRENDITKVVLTRKLKSFSLLSFKKLLPDSLRCQRTQIEPD